MNRYRATAVNPITGVTVTTQWFTTKSKMEAFAEKFGQGLTIHMYDSEGKQGSSLSHKYLGSK